MMVSSSQVPLYLGTRTLWDIVPLWNDRPAICGCSAQLHPGTMTGTAGLWDAEVSGDPWSQSPHVQDAEF